MSAPTARPSTKTSRASSNLSNSLLGALSDDDTKDHEEPSVIYSFSDSDDDEDFPRNFNEKRAIKELLSLNDSIKIFLKPEKQRDMGLEVGVNITEEFPWKQINMSVITNNLGKDDLPRSSKFVKTPRTIILEPNQKILVGYIAEQSKEEEDMFIFFETNAVAKEASAIIKNLEISRRKIAKAVVNKKTKEWISQGSEAEVDLYVPRKRAENIEVEIQSHYPIHEPELELQQRLCSDIRDGYVELIASKTKRFDNVNRLQIDVGVQIAPRTVNLELQTDPTFPTNAWSQYFYEVKKETDTAGVEVATDAKAIVTVPPPSNNINELLKALEFNEIDMYRNDYPDINKQNVCKFKSSCLSEPFCFLDLRRTQKRVISCIEWHPQLSGVAAVSYAFDTICTTNLIKDNTDLIKREIIEPNPVLVWSFENTIHPKIQFDSPREVAVLSFCPYDGDLLVGGTKNGQLHFWDLKNKMGDNKEMLLLPLAATSSLELSHKGAISCIRWLNRSHALVGTGQVKVNLQKNSRVFVTSSLDGSIIFWDLDLVLEERRNVEKVPESLAADVSDYNKFHGAFRPFFMLEYDYPILSFIIKNAEFKYEPKYEKASKLTDVIEYEVIHEEQELLPTTLKVSTMLGSISHLQWEGLDAITGTEFNIEKINNIQTYGSIHNGPVICMDRNPFIDKIFISICSTIFAIWHGDLYQSPIFLRKCGGSLTCCKFSLNRPSVFFLTKADGSLAIWDLLTRTDNACLDESICGDILTTISQHRLPCTQEILGLGDHNSTFRIFVIPSVYTKKDPNEEEQLMEFIDHTVRQKNFLRVWQAEWNEKHGTKAKKILEAAEQELMENMNESDSQLMSNQKQTDTNKQKGAKPQFKGINKLSDQLEELWIKLLYKHRMGILRQTLKAFEPPPEYVRIVEAEKVRRQEEHAATKDILRKTADLMVETNRRLLKTDEKGEERVVLLEKVVNNMMVNLDSAYSEIETGALKYVNAQSGVKHISLFEIVEKGIHRREVINKSLGVNTDHIVKYDRRKRKRKSELNFGINIPREINEREENDTENEAEYKEIEAEQ